MLNPFDDPDADLLVLVNDREQHSLWPAFAEVPSGWQVAHGPAGRADCLGYVAGHWTGPQPAVARAGAEVGAR